MKFGMIGGGFGAFIGDAHRRASRISNRFELTGGAFDVDYEKGKEFARSEGIANNRCYASIVEFITGELSLPANERIEAVAIVTPNFLHFPHAKLLLENGFHVMCEKPMTMTVEEAEELQQLVATTGLTFALAHTYTGYPMVREMRELIKQRILGDIQRVDAQYYQGWINSIIHGRENKITGVWRLEPTRVYMPGNAYNTEFADISITMPAGHPEGIYESLANIYSGFAKSIRDESFTEGEFPTVNEGVRGMKFVHSVVKSNKENSSWVDL